MTGTINSTPQTPNFWQGAKKLIKSFFTPPKQISEKERTEMLKVLSHMDHLYSKPEFDESINTMEMKNYCRNTLVEIITKYKCDDYLRYISDIFHFPIAEEKRELLENLKNMRPKDINYALVFRVPYVIMKENYWISNLDDFKDIEAKFEPFFKAQIKKYKD